MFQNFCVRASLIAFCVFSATNLTAGVSADTTIQTQEGPKPIKILKIGDRILCSNMKDLSVEEKPVVFIRDIEASNVIEITTSDDVSFYVTPDQKLFVTHKWVEAKNLTIEDVLMKKDHTFVRVIGIRHLDKPMNLRYITVDEHENFFAAENGVLIHNLTGGGVCGFFLGRTIVSVVGHTIIAGISISVGMVSGPAAPATMAGTAVSLEVQYGALIEAAAMKVGMGCAVIGAIITGPI